MPPDRHVILGVGAVVVQDARLLMIERAGTSTYGADGAGTWTVPGGWVEAGEQIEATAVRETHEETSVIVAAPGEPAMLICRGVRDDWIVSAFVPCQYVMGEPRVTEPDKCPRVEWVRFSAVESRPLFPVFQEWWRRWPGR